MGVPGVSPVLVKIRVRLQQFGQSEVSDLYHTGIGDQHVRRLQVPMHNPLLVSMLDGLGDVLNKLGRITGR